MELAGRNQVLPTRSVTEAIELMQTVGYDAIELSPLRGQGGIFPEITEDFMIRHVQECIQKKPGFFVSALSCHANYVTDDSIYSLQERLLRCAHRYGTDIVIMSAYIPYSVREEREKELYEQLIKKTRCLCALAEKEGVRIAIETEPNSLFQNLECFFRVAEEVRSPALKLNADLGHLFLSEADPIRAIEQAKDFIVHGHIENMCRGEHYHRLPWDGDMDLLSLCQILKNTGFDGTLALDLYERDYAAISLDCVNYIKDKIFKNLS